MTLVSMHHGRIKMFRNLVSFHHKERLMDPIDEEVDFVSQQLRGGLLVSDRNETRGGKLNQRNYRKPIRFII